MANTLKPKRSSVAGNIPTTTNLTSGEMGVNMADQKIWINNGTSVVQIGSGKVSGLADVVLSSLATGQGLSWNGTNWVNSNAGTGTVTSVSGTGTVSGLTLTGSVTSSGSLTLGGTLSLTSGQVTTALGYTPLSTAGGTLTGTLFFGNASSPNTNFIQFGDNTGWTLRMMTNVSGTPTERFRFVDTGAFNAVGAITQNGNQVLHAGNFSSYAPSLSSTYADPAWITSLASSKLTGTIDNARLNGGTYTINITGNAGTATALQTARTINGVSFNGTANITVADATKLPLSGGTVSGVITSSISNGTVLNMAGQSDSFGYNGVSGLGTYIKGTGSTYIYGGGKFWDGSTAHTLLHAGNFTSYAPGLTGSGASGTWGISVTGNAGTATTLQTSRTINGIPFNGSAAIDTTEWFHSDRDFPNGTLITTNINYAVTNGDPFVLEIRGNSYGNIVPLDLLYQGYIYADTIINHGGVSNGFNISGLVAINNGGNLCFWFPSQGYWNGYNVKVYSAYATRATNRVTSITGVAKPTTAKEVALSANIRQSLHSGNYTSYSPSLTGSGASGTWGISVTGSANSLNLSGHTISNSSWAGGGGYHGYQFNGGNWRFGFSSTGGVVDVYADGNFYATDSSHLVLHVGNISSYAISSSGGTISGNNFIDFGPNSSWGATLRVGGNGHGGATRASVATTNGNLHLDGTTSRGVYLNWYNASTEGTFFGNGAGGQVGRVDGGGNATFSGNVSGASDERLKTDWEALPANFIERLAKVKSGTYTRLDSGARQAGASAQDMQRLLKETVMTADDEAGTLSLAYGNAALVSAIELAKDNVDLRARVAKLEALVSKLIEG